MTSERPSPSFDYPEGQEKFCSDLNRIDGIGEKIPPQTYYLVLDGIGARLSPKEISELSGIPLGTVTGCVQTLSSRLATEGPQRKHNLIILAVEQGWLPPSDLERLNQPPPPSAKELQVLKMISLDLTDKEIASSLDKSIYTVQSQLRTLLRKLGCRNRLELAILAMERGLIDITDLEEKLDNRSDTDMVKQLKSVAGNPQQRGVLELIGKGGLPNKEIAQRLDTTEEAVVILTKKIKEKLNVKSRIEIAIFCFIAEKKLKSALRNEASSLIASLAKNPEQINRLARLNALLNERGIETKVPLTSLLDILELLSWELSSREIEEFLDIEGRVIDMRLQRTLYPLFQIDSSDPGPPKPRERLIEKAVELDILPSEEKERARQIEILETIIFFIEKGFAPEDIKDIIRNLF